MRACRWLLALAVTASVFVGVAGASHGAARPGTSLVSLLPGVEGVAAAVVAQERNVAQLLEIDGVVGAGVGAGEDGVAVVKVYAESALVAGVPATLDGVPVDVEITGRIVASGSDPQGWFPRPVPTGVSTGHPDVTAGTIGARVTKDGNVYALSNNHVIANSNDASIGDNILQPGPLDGGLDPEDTIGLLSEFVQINFAGADNTIDAAIAQSSPGELANSTPSGGYGTPSSTTVAAYVGQPVQKYGRTTGLTRGFVDALNVDIVVCYEPFGDACLKEAEFVDQIAILGAGGSNFSNGGDSGSLIVTDDANLNPVGLLFASGGGTTFGNPIDLVLSAFGVTIDGGGAPPPPPPPPTPPPPPPPPVDETPPETSISSGPSGTTTSTSASFSFSANEPSTFECNIDSAGWVGCSSPQGYSGLGVGAHTFLVRATDGSSNTDPSPASRSWTIEAPPTPPSPPPPPGPPPPPPPPPIDETPPETAITSGPPVTTTSTDATLQFTAGEEASFECDLDGAGWVACTSPQVYSNLTVGGHTFSVRATDPSDNTDATPATRSWTVEALPPGPPPPASPPPASPPPVPAPAGPPVAPAPPAETLPAPDEPRRPELFIAVSRASSPGGTKLANEDVAGYDGSSFVLYFDGSDVGLRRLAIDALAIAGPDTILLSFSAPGKVPGVGKVDDSDIVQFNASSLGPRTAGTFSMYFDGSDVGLTRNGEDVDAIELLPNGRILISTSGTVRVPGATGADEDLLSFRPSQLGASTRGRWSRYFDGSDVALDTSRGEDLDGAAVRRGDVFFSTRGTFSVQGLAGADEDVSRFDAKRLGHRTSGRFMTPPTLDGSTVGLRAADVTALDLP